jgi:hypothetical protein
MHQRALYNDVSRRDRAGQGGDEAASADRACRHPRARGFDLVGVNPAAN